MRTIEGWAGRIAGGVVTALSAITLVAGAADAQLRGTAVGAGNYTGSRTEAGGQIVTGGNYATDGQDLTISWVIVPETASLLRYTYTFTGFGGRQVPDISHFILGLSAGCDEDAGCFADATLGEGEVPTEIGTFTAQQGNSNPGLGAPLFGAKLDDGAGAGTVYSFLSNRVAVWGDFYIKGGSGSFAQNAALLPANAGSTNAGFYVARPDGDLFDGGPGGQVVPEPSTWALLGTGILGLAGVAARRRRQG